MGTFSTMMFEKTPKFIPFLIIGLFIFIQLVSCDHRQEFQVLPNQKERCLHKFQKNLMITKSLAKMEKNDKNEESKNQTWPRLKEEIGVFVYYSGADEEKPVGISCGFLPDMACYPKDEKERENIEHILKHDYKLSVNETHIGNTPRLEYEKHFLSHEFCASGFCEFFENTETSNESKPAESKDEGTTAKAENVENTDENAKKENEIKDEGVKKQNGEGTNEETWKGKCSKICVKGLGCGKVHNHTTSTVFDNGEPPKDEGTTISKMDFGIHLFISLVLIQYCFA